MSDAACNAYLCLGLTPQRLCNDLTAKAHDRHRGAPKGRPSLARTNLTIRGGGEAADTLLALFPELSLERCLHQVLL